MTYSYSSEKMFTSQATIERRAAKEARLHKIEERLDDLASAIATAASTESVTDVSDSRVSDLQTEMQSITARLSTYALNLDEIDVSAKKRLDELESSPIYSTMLARLDALTASNKEFERISRARFAVLEDEISATKSSLENIKKESEEALKSLEKKIAAAAKPIFPTKNTSTTSNK
jgi:hypothetical protein